jgi:hypothetical protein
MWLGLAVVAFAVGSGESRIGASSGPLVAAGAFILLVGAGGMASAIALLRSRSRHRYAWLAVLVSGVLQLAVLLPALSLRRFTHSGSVWLTTPWRTLLWDLQLIQLFAYYPWLGAMALAAVSVLVLLAGVKLPAGVGSRKASVNCDSDDTAL